MTIAIIDCSIRETITKIYHQLFPLAVTKTLYLVGDQALSEDIVHDVFEKLWKSKMQFQEIKIAYQWIYVSCHNAAIDYLRKRGRRSNLLNALIPMTVSIPKQPDDRITNRQFLTKVIHLLNDREAKVLAYLAIDGCTQRQIASILDVSDKTVQRIVASLEEKLKPIRGVFYE